MRTGCCERLTDRQDSYGPTGPKTGRTKVNLGAIYVSSKDPKPLLVVGQTSAAGATQFPTVHESSEVSSTRHFTPVHDAQTGYEAPSGLEVVWSGENRDGKGKTSAKLVVDKLGTTVGEGGLIEKVDVLAEIPYVIKKALSATTGIKPYVFQVSLDQARLSREMELTTVPQPGNARGRTRRGDGPRQGILVQRGFLRIQRLMGF